MLMEQFQGGESLHECEHTSAVQTCHLAKAQLCVGDFPEIFHCARYPPLPPTASTPSLCVTVFPPLCSTPLFALVQFPWWLSPGPPIRGPSWGAGSRGVLVRGVRGWRRRQGEKDRPLILTYTCIYIHSHVFFENYTLRPSPGRQLSAGNSTTLTHPPLILQWWMHQWQRVLVLTKRAALSSETLKQRATEQAFGRHFSRDRDCTWSDV